LRDAREVLAKIERALIGGHTVAGDVKARRVRRSGVATSHYALDTRVYYLKEGESTLDPFLCWRETRLDKPRHDEALLWQTTYDDERPD